MKAKFTPQVIRNMRELSIIFNCSVVKLQNILQQEDFPNKIDTVGGWYVKSVIDWIENQEKKEKRKKNDSWDEICES